MKYFTFGKMTNCFLVSGVVSLVLGIAAQKAFPETSGVFFSFSATLLFCYMILLFILIKITNQVWSANKEADLNAGNRTGYVFFQYMNLFRAGFAIGLVVLLIGLVFGDTRYPNSSFYWSSIGSIVLCFTGFLYAFALTIFLDAELLYVWNLYKQTHETVVIIPFHIGQRPAGFRLFFKDIFVLVACSLVTLLLWCFLNDDNMVILFLPLPTIVVFHFFLFCNVFRISRKLEILWSVVFIYNLIMRYYWCLLYQNPIEPMQYWKLVLLMQLPLTCGVNIIGLLSYDYHGIFYNYFPWGRKVTK